MSKMQTQRRNQAKLARLEIVSQMFLRQYTVRQIRAEVMKRLNLSTYSTATVQNDITNYINEAIYNEVFAENETPPGETRPTRLSAAATTRSRKSQRSIMITSV